MTVVYVVNKNLSKTLPTGEISMSQINVELGHAANAPISLGQADVRELAEVLSGQISLSDLQGKSFVDGVTLTVGQNADQAVFISRGYNDGTGVDTSPFGACDPLDIENTNLKLGGFWVGNSFGTMQASCEVNPDSLVAGSSCRVVFPEGSGLADIVMPYANAGNWNLYNDPALTAHYNYLSARIGTPVVLKFIAEGTPV